MAIASNPKSAGAARAKAVLSASMRMAFASSTFCGGWMTARVSTVRRLPPALLRALARLARPLAAKSLVPGVLLPRIKVGRLAPLPAARMA